MIWHFMEDIPKGRATVVYTQLMTKIATPAEPAEAELRAWRTFFQPEQLARCRDSLLAHDAGGVRQATIADVLAAAHQRAAVRRR